MGYKILNHRLSHVSCCIDLLQNKVYSQNFYGEPVEPLFPEPVEG